jgi:hypothetical protein
MAITKIPEQFEAIRAGILDFYRSGRSAAARNVNLIMTTVYWQIGRRMVESEQNGRQRVDCGKRLIERSTADLTKHFAREFGTINLWRMRAFLPSLARRANSFSTAERVRQLPRSRDLEGSVLPCVGLAAEFLLPSTADNGRHGPKPVVHNFIGSAAEQPRPQFHDRLHVRIGGFNNTRGSLRWLGDERCLSGGKVEAKSMLFM